MARTVIVGDIHGCLDELDALLGLVGLNDDDLLVSLGDVVDRGPDSAGCVRRLRERPNTVVLCGNHERKHVRGLLTYAQEIVRLQLRLQGDEAYAEAVGWMGTLPYYLETPEARLVHAAVVPGTPLADTPPEILSGTTSGERALRELTGDRPWVELYDDDIPVVFGHTVVGEHPLVMGDRVFGIDTGCCHGLRLTALTLPDRHLWSVPARADHWRAEQRRWQIPVLRERPWAEMTWAQLGKKADELERRHPGAAGWLGSLRAWAEGARGAIPDLHRAASVVVEQLEREHGPEGFARAAAAHPASKTLFALRAGRLQPEHMGCASPRDVDALALALGVDLVPPLPDGHPG